MILISGTLHTKLPAGLPGGLLATNFCRAESTTASHRLCKNFDFFDTDMKYRSNDDLSDSQTQLD